MIGYKYRFLPMPTTTERIPLPSPAPGTERSLLAHRYGRPGARPKVYVQAALHADEIPGLLVAQHLLLELERFQAQGAVQGEVVVVPAANPVGLAQHLGGRLVGRFDLAGSGNFNRDFPDLAPAVLERVRDVLGADPAANVAAVRKALGEALADLPPAGEADTLKRALLGLAQDADLVLDLHCAGVALQHLYASAWQPSDAAALGAELGARAVMLDGLDGTEGMPMDQACHGPWWKLRRRLPEGTPLPLACFAATVELRGQGDVTDPLAAADAAALVRFLQRRGALGGDPGPVPAARCDCTPLEAVDTLVAPGAGVVVYRRGLGDQVAAGELVAEIVAPFGEPWGAARTPVYCAATGLLFAHAIGRLVSPGQKFCKVAGREPLAYRRQGKLLGD